jgi:hypothetical protein
LQVRESEGKEINMKILDDMYKLRIDPKTGEVLMTLSELAQQQARHFHDGIHLGGDIQGIENPFSKLMTKLTVDDFAEFFSLGLHARLNNHDHTEANITMLQWLTDKIKKS